MDVDEPKAYTWPFRRPPPEGFQISSKAPQCGPRGRKLTPDMVGPHLEGKIAEVSAEEARSTRFL